jgi:hypothetical protein
MGTGLLSGELKMRSTAHLLRKLFLGTLGTIVLVCGVGTTYVWFQWIRMPGTSYSGGLPQVDSPTALAGRLNDHVQTLAGEIGERNVFHPHELSRAADYVEAQLELAGYSVDRFSFDTPISAEDKMEADSFYVRKGAAPSEVKIGDKIEVHNLVAERPGKLPGYVVIAAHYDSVLISPGADDNASGVAALIELARVFGDVQLDRSVRFVAFTNEEPLMWRSEHMGSIHYARQMKNQGEEVYAMLSIDGLGYYSDEEGSQHYPPPVSLFYPSKANFVAFVSNVENRSLVRRAVKSFRDSEVPLASIGAAMPPRIAGTDLSDHSSFWQFGYPGALVTDTNYLRTTHYHFATDLPDKLNYDAMAVAVDGLAAVIADLAGSDTASTD